MCLSFAWTKFVTKFTTTPVRSGDRRALQKEKLNRSEVAPKGSLGVREKLCTSHAPSEPEGRYIFTPGVR